MFKNFSKHLEGDQYSGIVTVFSVLLAVEYAGGLYDLWDVFVGVICLYVGNSFIKGAREKADALYSYVTGCLLSLGVVGIISGIFGIYLLASKKLNLITGNQYIIELIRFIIFFILSIVLTKVFVIETKTPNKAN